MKPKIKVSLAAAHLIICLGPTASFAKRNMDSGYVEARSAGKMACDGKELGVSGCWKIVGKRIFAGVLGGRGGDTGFPLAKWESMIPRSIITFHRFAYVASLDGLRTYRPNLGWIFIPIDRSNKDRRLQTDNKHLFVISDGRIWVSVVQDDVATVPILEQTSFENVDSVVIHRGVTKVLHFNGSIEDLIGLKYPNFVTFEPPR